MTAITYATHRPLTSAQFIDVLQRSTLATRRPVHDLPLIEGALLNSNLLVTAWDGDLLVGVSRSVTDFHYCCYLSDLAVDETYQRHGIGRMLIHHTQAALGPGCKIILLAAPAAVDYYPRIGFEHHPQAWTLPRDCDVRSNKKA